MNHINEDKEWDLLCSFIPLDLSKTAVNKLAIRRFRHLYEASDLLRICLAYGYCDMSLRQVAAWATAKGVGDFSNVAILKRLRNCEEWLSEIIYTILRNRKISLPEGMSERISLLDATDLRKLGSSSSDYRLHMNMDLKNGRIRDFKLTDIHEGESLKQHHIEKDVIYIGDRGYASGSGINYVKEKGGKLIVRLHQTRLKLFSSKGKELDLVSLLSILDIGDIGDWNLSYKIGKESYKIRLVAIRKTKEAEESEQKRQKRKAQSNGREISEEAKELTKYLCIVTTLGEEYNGARILEMYKYRWQIELLFKRLKGLMKLDNTRGQSDKLCRVYYLSKLLGALLVEELNDYGEFFSPWGYKLQPLEDN